MCGASLSLIEKEALSLGLKYCFKPHKLNYTTFFLSFEKLFRQLSTNSIYKCIPDALNFVKTRLKDIAFRNYYDFHPSISKHQARITSALKSLSSRKDIIISKPDKSNGIVIMNKSDYISKMNLVLEDSTKFKKIEEDVYKTLLQREDKNNRLVNEIYKKGIINEETKNKLRATGSTPGTMYGLPKIHKTNVPLRPILSSIGTANYECSKFLVNILSECIDRKFMVKDSFSFCEEIVNLKMQIAFDMIFYFL